MSELPPCPKCSSLHVYEYENMYVCPECAYEWTINEISEGVVLVVHDSCGNVLNDGDFITVIKDLKIKGSSYILKVGTKVRIIRLTEGDHNIDCKIEGVMKVALKSEFVKKAKQK